MQNKQSRRELLQRAAATGIGLGLTGRGGFVIGAPKVSRRSANEKLDIACIGVGGQGVYDSREVSSENIVAICDVDDNLIADAATRFPNAKHYHDFRKLLDKEKLDAVVIATPDHTHAPITMAALRRGLHVYCEKPLTHTVYEARKVRELALETGATTQMGTQIHARDNYRRVVELIETGAIGKVHEVHVWVNHQWGGYAHRPEGKPPVPDYLNYDLWLGPAAYRPYHPDYLPQNWRSWWDFGGGTLADMACHFMDLPFWALKLRTPLTIEAEGPPVHSESCPIWSIVRYTFPARGEQPPVKLKWYHGGVKPPQFYTTPDMPSFRDGVLFVGEEGWLISDYARYVLLPENKYAGFTPPDKYIPDSIGHHREWIEACKTGKPTLCHFGYAGPLTETVLLGNIAYRSGEKLEWDPQACKIKNSSRANDLLHKEYRDGWTL